MSERDPLRDPHPPRHPGRDPQRSVYAESDTDLLSPGTRLVAVGFTHRTAPLAVRSRFAVPRADLPLLARRFAGLPGVSGCVLLATCNRLEAYLEIRSEAEAEAAFVDLVGGRDLEGRHLLARSLMVRGGGRAVRHLFRVAAGLDSMVLGDAQILGQVKTAYRVACAQGTAGPLLHRAVHQAFRCARAVRGRTPLGEGALSVGGVAVSLLAERLGGVRGRPVLLVGAGEMVAAAGRRLADAGARLLLCNRTPERGRLLAAELGAEQRPWPGLLEAVAGADACLTCTGAMEPVLRRADLAAAARRRGRPLLVVDIAVPPDLDPADVGAAAGTGPAAAGPVATAPGEGPWLHVLDLEAVGACQERTERRRCEGAAAGEAIVREQVAAFGAWLRDQELAPRLGRLRREAELALQRELARAEPEERSRLEAFGRTLVKRFLGACRRVEDEAAGGGQRTSTPRDSASPAEPRSRKR